MKLDSLADKTIALETAIKTVHNSWKNTEQLVNSSVYSMIQVLFEASVWFTLFGGMTADELAFIHLFVENNLKLTKNNLIIHIYVRHRT